MLFPKKSRYYGRTTSTLKQVQNNKSNSQESPSASIQTGNGGKAIPAVPVLQWKNEAGGSADHTNFAHQVGPFQLKNDSALSVQNRVANSDKTAQLQAIAFAQRPDIPVGEGQEKHLPHEAWHVVQQQQGRVKPTAQMKGSLNVNNTNISPIQRKVQAVQVTWDVTHLVYEVDGSLFGGDDFAENEGQELTAGTKLLIDDASTFISRRGSNQEDRGKRATEKNDLPSVTWYQVMQLPNGLDISSRNLYIRKGTFMTDNTNVPGQLCREDKYWLEKFASEARGLGETTSDLWRDRTNVCTHDRESTHTTIRHMFSLKSLGEMIVQNAGIFRVFSDRSISPAAASDLIAKYALILSANPRYIGTIVHGLRDIVWGSLQNMADYLAIPYNTLVSTFEQMDSVEKQRGMFRALAQSEQNIEKYTTLLTGRLMLEMVRGGGIVEELKAMLLGHPTAKYSLELLIDGIAGDFYTQYVKLVNAEDESMKKSLFNTWLSGRGFTLDAFVTALSSQFETVDRSVVASRWKAFIKKGFELYESDSDTES